MFVPEEHRCVLYGSLASEAFAGKYYLLEEKEETMFEIFQMAIHVLTTRWLLAQLLFERLQMSHFGDSYQKIPFFLKLCEARMW